MDSMKKQDIEVWKNYNHKIKQILSNLAIHYIEIFNLSYFEIDEINIAELEITLIDDWTGGPDYKYFTIKSEDLLCPVGVVNKWRLNKKGE